MEILWLCNQSSKKKNEFKNENNLRDLQDNTKCTSISIIGIPEGERREKGVKSAFDKTMIENSQSWRRKEISRLPEAQRIPNKMNLNRPTPRHIIIKMAKVKEIFLKAAIEKQRVIYKKTTLR